MSNIRYYAPTGTTEITLSSGTKLAVNSSGYVTADAGFAPELQRAGFTAGTEDSVQAVTGPNGEVSLQAGGKTIPQSTALATGLTNSSGLARFRAAMAAAIGEYGIARINCLGDSITLGTYSNDSSIPVDSVADVNGYVGRLRTMFARRFGGTPAGFMPANDERNTVTGGTASTSTGLCINTVRTNNTTTLGGAVSLGVGNTISFPVPACTHIEIVYLDSSSATPAGAAGALGTFSYAVDGGGATTTTADTANPINYKRITISGLANTTHTLLLTGVTGTCLVFGIFYYGDAGVVVSRFGLGGATCLDLLGRGVVTHLSAGAVQRIGGFIGPAAAPVLKTLSITAGSAVATLADTTGLAVGMPVGSNSSDLTLPSFIQSVDSATQITLTAPALATNASRNSYIGAGTTCGGDLWIIPIGHNDWQQQNSAYPTPVSVFTTEMQLIIDSIEAAGGCVLLVGEPKSNNPAPTPETNTIEAYWAALDELALANTHVASMHINKVWGAFSTGTTLGLQSTAGGVHPLKKGSADMARIIFDALTYAPQA